MQTARPAGEVSARSPFRLRVGVGTARGGIPFQRKGGKDVQDPVGQAHEQWVSQGWGQAADGMSAVLDLVRVHRLLTQRVDRALRPFELTFASYEVLMLLSFTRRGAMSIGHMGRLLQVHSTSISSTVDRLENDKLVQRVKSEVDRRMVLAKLTPRGRQAASTSTQALNSQVFAALGISTTQERQLWAVLRAFRANAGDFDVLSARERRTG